MRCSICGKKIKGIVYWINGNPVCGDCFQRHVIQRRKYSQETYMSKADKVLDHLEAYHRKDKYDLITEFYEEKEDESEE